MTLSKMYDDLVKKKRRKMNKEIYKIATSEKKEKRIGEKGNGTVSS